jgi:hypothetical protein
MSESANAGPLPITLTNRNPGGGRIDLAEVRSRHDIPTGYCFYTIESAGAKWTVSIPLADLNRHGEDIQARRDHLTNALEIAMRGEPDKPPDSPKIPETSSIPGERGAS